MTQQTSPFVEGKYGWSYGEDGWNVGADENWLKYGYLLDNNVNGVVSTLPTLVDGESYFLTADSRFYFAVGGNWYSSPCPKWFIFKIKDSGDFWWYDGVSAVAISNPQQLSDAITTIQSSLGTAAYVNIEDLATQAELDIASTQAAAYTDTLRSDLSADAGSSLVGFKQRGTGSVPRSMLDKARDAVNVKDFGAVGDGVADDTAAINAAKNALPSNLATGAGGIIYFPAGVYRITSPIYVRYGQTLMGAGSSASVTKLSIDPTFAGDAAVVAVDNLASFIPAHIVNLSIDGNNVPGVGGILYTGAYQNASIDSVFITDIHGGSIPIDIRPMTSSETPSPMSVCESILLKDIYAQHYPDAAAVTTPAIRLVKCQETTLINVKAFGISAAGGGTPTPPNTPGIYLEDCRGVTIIGGAATVCKYGIKISAISRGVSGITVVGSTFENVSDSSILITGSPTARVSQIEVTKPRFETPAPVYGITADYLSDSRIDTASLGANIGANCFALLLIDSGSATYYSVAAGARYSRIVPPNGVSQNHQFYGGSGAIEVIRDNTPAVKFTVPGRSDSWNWNWGASSTINNGFRLVHSSGRIPIAFDDAAEVSRIGFFGSSPTYKPTVTGSVGGNAALSSLCTALASLGLIVNSTTA